MEKEKETKRDYESPSTEKTTVEMQGYLCGSIETKGEEADGVNIKSQDVSNSQENDWGDEAWSVPTTNN